MDTTLSSPDPAPAGSWRKAFRPFWWWLPVGVALVVADVHRRLIVKTYVEFEVLLEGKSVTGDYTASFNGEPVMSGQRAGIGSGRLTVSMKDADPVERTAFVWYGDNNLGSFELKLHRGGLEVVTEPTAGSVSIKGTRHAAESTEQPAKFDSIPVGSYRVSAAYPWSRAEETVEVLRGETKRVEFRPQVGMLEILSEPKDATFTLALLNAGRASTNGRTPALVRFLPVGEYRVRVSRGDYLKEARAEVKLSQTNRVSIAFEYGQVQVISDPPGATVWDADRELGTTPKVFAELQPGNHRLRLQLEGYQPAMLDFRVEGTDPITIRTNLIHVGYANAMREARSLGAARDFAKALEAVGRALAAQPSDEAAAKLKAELESGQTSAQAQQAEQDRAAELERRRREIAAAFKQATDELKDAALFDTHTWTVKGPLDRVVAAMKRSFELGQAKWAIEAQAGSEEQGHRFDCKAKGAILTRRRCVVMANAFGPDEVIVQGKFWDYVLSSKIEIFGTDNWIPIHPSRVQGSAPDIDARRKVLPELFWTNLQAELQR